MVRLPFTPFFLFLFLYSPYADLLLLFIDAFDSERAAYYQRLKESAASLAKPGGEPLAPAVHICWHCTGRGHLNETINDITVQLIQHQKAYQDASRRANAAQNEPVPTPPSAVEMATLDSQILIELMNNEALDAEYLALQAELEAELQEHEKQAILLNTSKRRVLAAQQEVEALEIQADKLIEDLQRLPKLASERWLEFFGIEEVVEPFGSFGRIRGVPLAVGVSTGTTDSITSASSSSASNVQSGASGMSNSASADSSGALRWQENSRDAQNVSSAITMLSVLVNRMTAVARPSTHKLITERKYRVLSSPPTMSARFPSDVSYSLLPFQNDRVNSHWAKALLELSHAIFINFRVRGVAPRYPTPSRDASPDYYVLDINSPHQWNEKMMHLLANCKQLIKVSFPAPPSFDPSATSLEALLSTPWQPENLLS